MVTDSRALPGLTGIPVQLFVTRVTGSDCGNSKRTRSCVSPKFEIETQVNALVKVCVCVYLRSDLSLNLWVESKGKSLSNGMLTF